MKYKGKRPSKWPWERGTHPSSTCGRNFPSNYSYKRHDFESRCLENEFPDVDTKIVALRASPSVVSLVSYLDGMEIFQGSGTIIEEEGTILTSAKLVTCPKNTNVFAENVKVIVHLWDGKSYDAQILAHDFYYGLAVVKIQENVAQLKPACLRFVDDSASFVSSELSIHDYKGFQPRPQSNAYCHGLTFLKTVRHLASNSHTLFATNLDPGNKVIVLGRNFIKPYEIMAAPGEFSIQRCSDKFECKELFRATCLIAQTGHGGPLVNGHGEVIGVASFDVEYTPFVPINVALKWWQYFKEGKLSRPFLGMELANLYNPNLKVTEKAVRKFTNNYAGVFVEKVKQGSSAHTAGICPNDIIVECCGKPIRSFLELYDIMWDNVGDLVPLFVIRASDDDRLKFTMNVIDATQGG